MRTMERGRWGRSSRSPANIKSNFFSTSRSKPILEAKAEREKRRKELNKQMHQQKYYELGKMHIQHIISNKVDVSISTTTIKENLKLSSQPSSDLFCVSEEVRTETKQTTNKSKNHKTSTSTFTLISLISIGNQIDKVIMTNIVMK